MLLEEIKPIIIKPGKILVRKAASTVDYPKGGTHINKKRKEKIKRGRLVGAGGSYDWQ